MKKILKLITKHKIAAGILAVLLISAGYYGYSKLHNGQTITRYALAVAEKGTLITSVSGSGQVAVSNQVEVKAKVSGDVVSVKVKKGQEVKTADVLVQLDTRDALKAVRDGKTSLETAQLSLDKLKQPADEYTLFQAENSLTSARTSLEKLKLSQQTDYQNAQEAINKAEDDLANAYDSAFNTIADTFLDLPNVMTKLHDVLYSYEIGTSESSVGRSTDNNSALMNSMNTDDRDKLRLYQNSAVSDYTTARAKYDLNFDSYKSSNRYSDRATIENLLTQTLATVKAIAQAAKSQSNYLDTWVDLRASRNLSTFTTVTGYLTSLSTYTSQTNSHLSSLSSSQSSLDNSKDTLTSAQNDLITMGKNQPLDLAASENAVIEKENSLAELKAGTDALDLRSQQLAVEQKQDALYDARAELANYTVRAPFDGLVAEVAVKVGDSVSGTAVATVITKQSLAEISLNEVDAAKVEPGQKATLTFDAVSDLSITGEVAEIDTLGTVSQGVVTYNAKIVFDTQDNRIKPGMSVSANVITDSKQDVIIVPNAAVQSSNNIYYVQLPNEQIATSTISANNGSGVVLATPPRQQAVEIGLANDSMTEITSGLEQGDLVITQTTSSSAAKTTNKSVGGGFIMGGMGSPR